MRFDPIAQLPTLQTELTHTHTMYSPKPSFDLADVGVKVNELVERVNALAELIENICETNNLWDGS